MAQWDVVAIQNMIKKATAGVEIIICDYSPL